MYPLIWYYTAPDSALPGAPLRSGAPTPARAATSPDPKPIRESGASEADAVARRTADALPRSSATDLEPLSGPGSPRLPTADEPEDLLAMMPELKETLARVAEVQQRAHSPQDLDREVQTLDADPAKLAKLKAVADLFVKLPPSRGDDYLPSSSGVVRPSSAR